MKSNPLLDFLDFMHEDLIENISFNIKDSISFKVASSNKIIPKVFSNSLSNLSGTTLQLTNDVNIVNQPSCRICSNVEKIVVAIKHLITK